MRLITLCSMAILLLALGCSEDEDNNPTGSNTDPNTSISLDHVDGTSQGELMTNETITFYIRVANAAGTAITGATNGLRVYSPNGADWTTTTADTTGAISMAMFEQRFINSFSVSGSGADTVGFGGWRIYGTGIPDGFNSVSYTISIGPVGTSSAGRTICLDSAFYPPSGVWKWVRADGAGDFYPGWDGPHCWKVGG